MYTGSFLWCHAPAIQSAVTDTLTSIRWCNRCPNVDFNHSCFPACLLLPTTFCLSSFKCINYMNLRKRSSFFHFKLTTEGRCCVWRLFQQLQSGLSITGHQSHWGQHLNPTKVGRDGPKPETALAGSPKHRPLKQICVFNKNDKSSIEESLGMDRGCCFFFFYFVPDFKDTHWRSRQQKWLLH